MIWIEHAPAALVALLVVLLIVRPLAALGIEFGWIYKHKRPTAHVEVPAVPFVGGAAVLIGMLCAAFLSRWPVEAYGLALGLVLVMVLGSVEDRWPVRRRFWFAGLIAAATAAVIGGQHYINNTGPLLGTEQFPLSAFALAVSVGFVLLIALGFRTLDRADGLCDGQAFISTLMLGVVALFTTAGHGDHWPMPAFVVVSMSLLGALPGLAVYTWRRPGRRLASVFLGSGGAMALGLVLGWLALQLLAGFGESGPGLGTLLWLFAVPLADVVFYAFRRLLAGRGWQAGARFRLYHMVRAQHFPLGVAVVICHAVSIAAGLVGIIGWQVGVPDFMLFYGFWVSMAIYASIALAFWARHAARQTAPAGRWQTPGNQGGTKAGRPSFTQGQ